MEELPPTETKELVKQGSSSSIHSGELLAWLQEKGRQEKWAINEDEIELESKPFASGAAGEVYKAKWRGLTCVAKTCFKMDTNKQNLIDLGNEISVISSLRHPNLVMFLGACFNEKGIPTVLMEYCAGGNLRKRLIKAMHDQKPLKLAKKYQYAHELALGMYFLHGCSEPVIHRDLKPANILLSKDDHIKISDFGLSKFMPQRRRKDIEAMKESDRYTMTGETGSYRFMAPEVFRHEDYNEKVDVYSYAMIVYWIYTGVRPLTTIEPITAARMVAQQSKRPTLSSVKIPEVRKLLEDCWQDNPDARPSFEEIVERLEGLKIKTKSDGCCIS